MSSGVGLNSECLEKYNQLKLKKNCTYIIFGLSKDLKEIVVLKESESKDYDDFLKDLPEDDCRWAVYDVSYEKDGGKRNKLAFFIWSPDGAKIKSKMLYASSKDVLRRALVGVAAEVQGTDYDEVSWESVLDKVSRGN
ncbi:cofilin [Ceratobasidium sp. 394]|nr:cofilin [Ceratobasidium sp. 394]KAG9101857.1 cofilin [Ceratobasidium sp. UAMH 11750]